MLNLGAGQETRGGRGKRGEPLPSELEHLLPKDVIKTIISRAIMFREDTKTAGAISHWKNYVSHPAASEQLRKPAMVRYLVAVLRVDSGWCQTLFETIKAMLLVDYSKCPKAQGAPLEVLLPTCFTPDDMGRPFDFVDDIRLLLPDLGGLLISLMSSYTLNPPAPAETFVTENISTMLLQVWLYFTKRNLGPAHVAELVEALGALLKTWSGTPSAQLMRSRAFVTKGLKITDMFLRRALEINPEVALSHAYGTARPQLDTLTKRVAIESGSWWHLSVHPLHSPLPTSIAPPVPGKSTPLSALQGRELVVSPPAACTLLGVIDGWVKVSPGRVRPKSAAGHSMRRLNRRAIEAAGAKGREAVAAERDGGVNFTDVVGAVITGDAATSRSRRLLVEASRGRPGGGEFRPRRKSAARGTDDSRTKMIASIIIQRWWRRKRQRLVAARVRSAGPERDISPKRLQERARGRVAAMRDSLSEMQRRLRTLDPLVAPPPPAVYAGGAAGRAATSDANAGMDSGSEGSKGA